MAKIYVGNLPMDIMERDLDDMFGRYGRIRYIELKVPTRPPSFAFIEPVFSSLRGRVVMHGATDWCCTQPGRCMVAASAARPQWQQTADCLIATLDCHL